MWIGLSIGLAQSPAFPIENVTAGLTGYAVTAGTGNKLERFPIEVIALQYDVGLGFPLVLVKASGEFIESTGGVAAGMSGSPTYIKTDAGDALLGAISYVFPSSDHRLALVTPIEEMRGSKVTSYTPFGKEMFASAGDYVPVDTPLLLSGMSERAAARLESLFAGTTLRPLPVQTSGSFGPDESTYKLEPGSAISVQLSRGDVTLAGVGTVTEVSGDSVLAFGHPFFGSGEVSFALAPAFVSYIVPSDVVPFKLADNGQTLLGTITQDRPAAISGILRQSPDFLPITLTLLDNKSTVIKRFEIANDERYYAPILAAATLQLFDESSKKVGGGTAELAWEITFKDGQKVNVIEQATDPTDLASTAAGLAAAPLDILAENIFAKAQIAQVAISLRYEDRENYAEIVEVNAKSKEIKKGENVEVYIRLQPFRGDPLVKTLVLSLPEEAKGSVEIVFRGGLEGPEEDEAPNQEDRPILSFGELLAALEGNIQSRELLVQTTIDDEKERLDKQLFPYLIKGEESLTISIKDTEENTDESKAENIEEATPEEPAPEGLMD
jgi:hypothetical protein